MGDKNYDLYESISLNYHLSQGSLHKKQLVWSPLFKKQTFFLQQLKKNITFARSSEHYLFLITTKQRYKN